MISRLRLTRIIQSTYVMHDTRLVRRTSTTRPVRHSTVLLWLILVLLNDPRNRIQPLLQHIHPRSITQPNKVMARRVKQIPTPTRVQVEKDARHNNNFFLETSLEEVQSIVDALGQIAQIEPQVKRRVGHVGKLEADFLETAYDVVALGPEVHLQRAHLVANAGWRQHFYGGFLEGHVAATVEVGTAGADGLDEFLGANDPCYTPSGKTEALG